MGPCDRTLIQKGQGLNAVEMRQVSSVRAPIAFEKCVWQRLYGGYVYDWGSGLSPSLDRATTHNIIQFKSILNRLYNKNHGGRAG
jgi:hypothetical protein